MVAVLRNGKPANWASLREQEGVGQGDGRRGLCGKIHRGHGQPRRLSWPGPGPETGLLEAPSSSGHRWRLRHLRLPLVARHPHLRASVLEKPPVDRITRQSVAARGFGGRVEVIAADMFADPFPTQCDLHLFSNVLHDWDEDRRQTAAGQVLCRLAAGRDDPHSRRPHQRGQDRPAPGGGIFRAA